jgi:hypothetical protein
MDHVRLAKESAFGKIIQPRLRQNAGRLYATVTGLFAKNRKIGKGVIHGVWEV